MLCWGSDNGRFRRGIRLGCPIIFTRFGAGRECLSKLPELCVCIPRFGVELGSSDTTAIVEILHLGEVSWGTLYTRYSMSEGVLLTGNHSIIISFQNITGQTQ